MNWFKKHSAQPAETPNAHEATTPFVAMPDEPQSQTGGRVGTN